MNRLQQRQAEIIKEFSALTDWEGRYKKIIEVGKNLSELAAEHKVEINRVKGCQSQVWLIATLTPDKKVIFSADSDALIVRGLVSLLLRVYSEATPDEILASPAEFIEKLGFKNNLSPSRTNGLFSLVKQIQYYAMAFKAKLATAE